MTLIIVLTTRKLHFTLSSFFCKHGNYSNLTRSYKRANDKRYHVLSKRDGGGYDTGHHCQSNGLEIFAFLLFLVYLLDLLRNVLMNAMLDLMINDQTVTALQGNYIYVFFSFSPISCNTLH